MLPFSGLLISKNNALGIGAAALSRFISFLLEYICFCDVIILKLLQKKKNLICIHLGFLIYMLLLC